MKDSVRLARIPDEVLRIWSQLPKVECKGLCAEACGPWNASKLEVRLLEQHAPRPAPSSSTCPWLKDGRCSAYRIRPLVCRLYGQIDELPCGHGCKVVGPRLTNDEAWKLVEEIVVACGGWDTPWREYPNCVVCGLPLGDEVVTAQDGYRAHSHLACVKRQFAVAAAIGVPVNSKVYAGDVRLV